MHQEITFEGASLARTEKGVEQNYLANESGNSDGFSWTVGSRHEMSRYSNDRKETSDED